MIKQDYHYDHYKKIWTPTTSIRCRGKRKTDWYVVGTYRFDYNWKKPNEPMLAPTILSTWSK